MRPDSNRQPAFTQATTDIPKLPMPTGLSTCVVMQVGQKRGREEVDTLDIGEDGQPKKRVRTGFPASQWITVYNKGMPMKQR